MHRFALAAIGILTLLACAHSLGQELVRTRPLVVAHRGSSAQAPENTLVAYRLAIEEGAEMAECDVRATKDGVVVLMHDKTLDRTTDAAGALKDWNLEDLRDVDAGSWKSGEFKGERIPTLKEALQFVSGKMRFVIEIKEKNIEEGVLSAIRESRVAPESVMIFSFHREVVETIAKMEPLLPTTWLVDKPGSDAESHREVMRNALRSRCSALGVSKDHVDSHFVRRAHETGFPVFVWTVNDAKSMRELIALGVDGIISDRPRLLLDVIQGKPIDR